MFTHGAVISSMTSQGLLGGGKYTHTLGRDGKGAYFESQLSEEVDITCTKPCKVQIAKLKDSLITS